MGWPTLANPSLQTVLGAWQSQGHRELGDRAPHLGEGGLSSAILLAIVVTKNKKKTFLLILDTQKLNLRIFFLHFFRLFV